MRLLFVTLGFLLSFPAFSIERSVKITHHGDMTDINRVEIWGNYDGEPQPRKLLDLTVEDLEFKLDVDRCRFFYVQAKACNEIECTNGGAIELVAPRCVKSDPPSLDGV